MFRVPNAGEPAPFTIRAQQDFYFDQEKALGGKREKAISKYVPIYTHVPTRAKEASEEMQSLAERIASFRGEGLLGAERLISLLESQFELPVDPQLATRLLFYPDIQNLLVGILTVEESVLQEKIVADVSPVQGKEKIDVLYPEPVGMVSHVAEEVITVDNAKEMMREKAHRLFWQVDEEILETVIDIRLATLKPNLTYDPEKNNKRIEKIVELYPSEVIPYEPGDILAPIGKALDEEDVLLLSAYRDDVKKGFYGDMTWIAAIILVVVALHELFLSKVLTSDWRKEPPLRLLASMLIMTLLLCKGTLLFTDFSLYVMPFAVLPIMIILLCGERVYAGWTTLVGAILLSLFADRSWDSLVLFIISGTLAVLTSLRIQKRVHILFPALAVGISNGVILAALSLDWSAIGGRIAAFGGTQVLSLSDIFGNGMLEPIGWAFMGGFIAGPVAVLLLPLMEISQHATSTFKLNRFANLEHPLMKDLLTKTPATYQHTMTVAYLAEVIGRAVGADLPLLRVGAYYHDIGKMSDPRLFAENQSRGNNPHDVMPPKESAKLIINHVIYGEKIGRDMGLPEVVLDLIRQHHGTQLTDYFYSKALKTGNGGRVIREDFQYPGPKPQTVEAAILMIVDAVEAASRSLERPTRAKFEKMVRLLVMKRISDGQFDECNLSTRYVDRIIQTLTDALEASCHARVSYPWQRKQPKKKEEGAMTVPASENPSQLAPSPALHQAEA
jgi:putative nucleotidyltransferase with HDIG domain